MSSTKKGEKKETKFQVSQRLQSTKDKGWEEPLKQKFYEESMRDRSGDWGLLAGQPPLCISDTYENPGKDFLKNPRYNGTQFHTQHEKSGRDGLFTKETSIGIGSQFEPVEICEQRYMREQRKKKGPVKHPKEFTPAGTIKKIDKDVFLLEVDASLPNSTIKEKIQEREKERQSRIEYLKTAPPLLRNPQTNPPKKGTYGVINTALSKYPEHVDDDYNNAKKLSYEEHLLSKELCHSKTPFIKLPRTRPEGTFTLPKELYGTDVQFPEKTVEKEKPITVPWKHSNPPKLGGPGFPKITINPYPEHFEFKLKDNLPRAKTIDQVWHHGGIPKMKPAPSICLHRMNLRK